MIVKVKRGEFFYKWLEWLNPLIPLNTSERKVLSVLLGLHYTHKERYTDSVLQELLLSEDTQELIATKLKIPIVKIRGAFTSLKNKEILTDKGINPILTDYPKNNKFKIYVNFEFID